MTDSHQPLPRRPIPNRIAHTKARMQMAVALLPTAPDLPWQTMTDLLDEIAPPATIPGRERDVSFGVTVASDWHMLAWHVVDDRDFLLKCVGDNVQRMGAPASRLLPLIQASLATKDQRIGCWCKGDAGGVTAGWSLPAALPLAATLPLLPEHPASAQLTAWAKALAIPACDAVTHAYLGAASQTALHLPLPGSDIHIQLQQAQQLLTMLGRAPIADAAQAFLLTHLAATTPLALAVELNNHGIRQIGLNIPKPSAQLLNQLHTLTSGGPSQAEGSNLPSRLAAFQGMLGATEMASLRLVQDTQGSHYLYTYFPLGYDI